MTNSSVYVASIDAKDIYLSNISSDGQYTLKYRSGDYNYRKFINTVPYSLDLIKLREVYEKAYRNRDFSWWNLGKEYTTRIVNITFKYSVKEYNRLSNGLYIKCGYSYNDVKLSDSIDMRDGDIIALKTGVPVETPVDEKLLGKLFYFSDGVYCAKEVMPAMMSKAELRHHLYEHGFHIDGVKYVRFKRSAGSARVGKCLFIDEKLYGRMHKWDLAGLGIRKGNKIDLAAFESYISLTSSSIIDTMEIESQNILLIDDYESVFKDNAVATYMDDVGEIKTEQKDVEICNSIWDGQSLMDTSLFGKYRKYGFLLLRNRFFKSAAFHCNIQQFFADNGITDVSQLNGKTRAKSIEDIKLITTPSSIKYFKFGTFDQWLNNLDTIFGVVKHEKPTHFMEGRLVKAHYQLINSLQLSLDEVKDLLTPSLDYLRLLKTEPAVLRYHIKYPEEYNDSCESLLTKNDIVYKLLGINDDFAKTKLYVDFRNACTKSFVKDMRKGHILVNGNYSTLCGNPIEMLLSSIGKFDGISQIGVGNVCSSRFSVGQTVLGSRSPHVASGNVLLATNTDNEIIRRYFHMTDEIIYVNSINENLLERLSGADYDSDSLLITDNPILIAAARKNYEHFAVPTRLVQAIKRDLSYTNNDLAELDIRTSVNKIGEIVNLSQELNTLMWHKVNNGAPIDSAEVQDIYCDIAYLDVMSNVAIDNAKKASPINIPKELVKLKAKYERSNKDGKRIKPNFFEPVSKSKGYYNPSRNEYKKHDTSMDYVQTILNRRKQLPTDGNGKYTPFSEFVFGGVKKPSNKQRGQVQRILALVAQSKNRIKAIWSDKKDGLSGSEKYLMAERERTECVEYIGRIDVSDEVLCFLLKSIETKGNRSVYPLLFYSLFSVPNDKMFDAIRRKTEPIKALQEYRDGKIDIYGKKYTII
jgi:hypothetical protein